MKVEGDGGVPSEVRRSEEGQFWSYEQGIQTEIGPELLLISPPKGCHAAGTVLNALQVAQLSQKRGHNSCSICNYTNYPQTGTETHLCDPAPGSEPVFSAFPGCGTYLLRDWGGAITSKRAQPGILSPVPKSLCKKMRGIRPDEMQSLGLERLEPVRELCPLSDAVVVF